MRRIWAAVISTATLLQLVVLSPSASAQPAPCLQAAAACQANGQLHTGIKTNNTVTKVEPVVTRTKTNTPVRRKPRATAPPPRFFWKTVTEQGCFTARDVPPPPPPGAPPPFVSPPIRVDSKPDSKLVQRVLIDRETWQVVDSQPPKCVDPADPTTALPPEPPVPPSVEVVADEVWANSPILPPQIIANPNARGLTGLATEFRLENPQDTLTVTTNLPSYPGYSVTAQMRVTSYTWDFGDGEKHTGLETMVPHEYQRAKNFYTVTVTAVWEGSFTVTGPVGFPGDLDPATVSAEKDYPVIQARSVLIPA